MRIDRLCLVLDEISELSSNILSGILASYPFVVGHPVLQGRKRQLFLKNITFIE